MKTLRLLLLAVTMACLIVTAQAQDAVSDLLGRINSLRGSLGLHAYTLNSALNAAAANQAQWMAATGQISHTQADGSTPSSRAAAAGYGGSWVSENIYMGSHAGVGDAWHFWMNSSIHYRGMTNPNYQEIGIASAVGERGRAFVLVFGRVGGTPYVAPRGGGGGGDNRASAPPSFVVGLDAHGNIMHEVQPEQTIGHILLTYGYTWEDLPEFLTLNTKTDADIRNLQIGEIVLVPPYEGTYTPTPYPEGWPTNTPEPEDFVATAIAEAAAVATAAAQTPKPSPAASETPAEDAEAAAQTPDDAPTNPTPTPEGAADESTSEPESSGPGRIATAAGVPSFLSGGPAVSPTPLEPAASVTPDASPTPSPTLNEIAILETDFAPTPTAGATLIASIDVNPGAPSAPIQDVIAVTPPGESPWLVIALFVQMAIIVGAGWKWVRGGKRR